MVKDYLVRGIKLEDKTITFDAKSFKANGNMIISDQTITVK